jgi:uncharacterized membrane protein
MEGGKDAQNTISWRDVRMNLFRRSGSQLALLVLALAGMADAIYLTLVHYNDQISLACPQNAVFNCAHVITSTYSYVPGTSLPISLPGLAWCLVVAALALAGIFLDDEQGWLRITQFAWTLLGLLTALYLVYVEIVLLHNICIWCTVLHALILVMFLLTLVRLPIRRTREDEQWADEDRDEVVGEMSAEPKQ